MCLSTKTRWEDNMKINLTGNGWGGKKGIHPNRKQQREIVNIAMDNEEWHLLGCYVMSLL
jgi:hypothetical protein